MNMAKIRSFTLGFVSGLQLNKSTIRTLLIGEAFLVEERIFDLLLSLDASDCALPSVVISINKLIGPDEPSCC
jgi:hypothetical protein